MFTRHEEKEHPYRIIQNDVRVNIEGVNIKEEMYVNVSARGVESLWMFIRDMNRRFSLLELNYQLLFQGISIPGQIVASLSVRNVYSMAVLQVALDEAFLKMSQRESNSWEEVMRYYGLGRRGTLADANPDIIFAAPVIIGIHTDGAGGCNASSASTREYKVNNRVRLVVRSHTSSNENCGLECLRFKNQRIPSIESLRKKYDVKGFIEWALLEQISNEVDCPHRVVKMHSNKLLYMNDDFVDIKNNRSNLILLHRNHYVSIVDIKTLEHRCIRCGGFYSDKHTCVPKQIAFNRTRRLLHRGRDLFFDIETRNGLAKPFKVKDKIFYPQIPVLACAYIPATGTRLVFWGTDCITQFINWLDTQEVLYYIRAHNGGAFDYYYIIEEILKRTYPIEDFNFNNILLRGSSKILSIELRGNKFVDTYNHLTDSLDNLCKSFNVKTKKIKSQFVNGREWTSTDLMLYRQYELTPEQYIKELRDLGLDKAYEEYCMVDCISLSEVWEAYLLASCTLYRQTCTSLNAKSFVENFNSKLTIPSLAKWGWELKQKELKKEIWYPTLRTEPYDICYNAVIGGISHVQHVGHHTDLLVCLDVVSLYVWAMTSNVFPYGEPISTDRYREGKLGIYKCKKVVCSNDPIVDIPLLENGVLDWSNRISFDRSLSNIDIERIRRRGGTVEVDHGIFWDQSTNYFQEFLEPFTAEKKRQDTLINTNKYNPALRNVGKLTGNSIYGKMLERSSKTSLSIVDHPNDLFGMNLDFNQCWIYRSNGKYIVRTPSTGENKSPFHLGVFVLAYSRDLMMNFFDMVGRENVIATETDSLYIKKEHLYKLQSVIGKEIGMLSVDIDDITESYFLSKKGYALRYTDKGETKEKFRLKGVHKAALNWDKYVEWHEKGIVTFNDIQVFVRHLFDMERSQIHIGRLDKTVMTNETREKLLANKKRKFN